MTCPINVISIAPERMASLNPFPLDEGLEASDGPAVRIKDDLSQGRDAQRNVRALGSMDDDVRAFLC